MGIRGDDLADNGPERRFVAHLHQAELRHDVPRIAAIIVDALKDLAPGRLANSLVLNKQEQRSKTFGRQAAKLVTLRGIPGRFLESEEIALNPVANFARPGIKVDRALEEVRDLARDAELG